MNLPLRWRKSLPYVIAVVIGIGVVVAWRWAAPDGLPEGIAGGNGRLEATTIDVAAKSGGRLLSVRVREGDFVTAGDEIARMDTQSLDAQLRGAQAQLRQARTARATLTALVRQREQAVTTVASLVAQREAEAALAEKDLELRGPGDFLGTRQSGLPNLRIGQLSDIPTLVQAREAAQQLFEQDPLLSQYPQLLSLIHI